MATVDPVRRFAEQALKVEQAARRGGLQRNTNVAHALFVLVMASRFSGVSQAEVIEASGLTKDIISKVIGPLVRKGLLFQDRDGANGRKKRLGTTAKGAELIAFVKGSLQPIRSPRQSPSTALEPNLFTLLGGLTTAG